MEGDFILALIKHFPDITRKRAANILNTNILNAKVKLYYSMLASFIFKAKNKGLEFIKFLQFFNKLKGVLLYLRDKDKSKKILHISILKQVKLKKMAIALQDFISVPFTLLANNVYKLKAKKVQLVNRNNKIRRGLRGRFNQYKQFKAQNTPQKQVSKYQDYLLLRFTTILKSSCLILKQLAKLDIKDQL